MPVDFGEAQDCVNEDPRDTIECFPREFAAAELFKVKTVKNGYLPGEPRIPYGPAIGPFTDLYGLAATLFYGLTGHPPPMAPERERKPPATRHFPAACMGTCAAPFWMLWRCTGPIGLGMPRNSACGLKQAASFRG